ncbi:hypothetical protein [Methylobacterium frigidaeris]|uniref:Uncharacterized protein n=1 Tax=Methylobacterium frigidaeris TaxID=2038277 RepID=A0AA37HH09_9HYPH|nr:hypothetical protein [Methylobacterium frigidaeris]GJD65765.1 hypothetical protein MPEAHAMD_5960 [Methylobacterium frigidaeris]
MGLESLIPHSATIYEFETGPVTSTVANGSGATYRTAVMTFLTTQRLGFMRVRVKEVRYVNLYENVERRESDALLWDRDDGPYECTFTDGTRINALIGTTVLSDRLATDARDLQGNAKGAAAWSSAGVIPGVLEQTYLLAV